MKKDFVIIGGDIRMSHTAELLTQRGYSVAAFANPSAGAIPGVALYSRPEEAVRSAGTILLGIPSVKDGKILTPLCSCVLTPDELISCLKQGQRVMGMLPENFKARCAELGVICADFGKRDDFALLNAVPTAEALIAILIERLPLTLWGSKILILGYGRIGKVLARRLSALGADVTITARRSSDLALARTEGLKCRITDACITDGKKYCALINTIPQKLLTEKSFACLRGDCLVVDASAYPGNVSPEDAAAYGIEVIGAFGLPGKSSPVTAGEIIAETAINIIKEQTQLPETGAFPAKE